VHNVRPALEIRRMRKGGRRDAPRPSGLGSPFGCTPRPTLPDWLREQAQRATPLTYSLAVGSTASIGVKGALRRHRRPFGARAMPCAPHAASGAALDTASSRNSDNLNMSEYPQHQDY
jgi:hypothetical protein